MHPHAQNQHENSIWKYLYIREKLVSQTNTAFSDPFLSEVCAWLMKPLFLEIFGGAHKTRNFRDRQFDRSNIAWFFSIRAFSTRPHYVHIHPAIVGGRWFRWQPNDRLLRPGVLMRTFDVTRIYSFFGDLAVCGTPGFVDTWKRVGLNVNRFMFRGWVLFEWSGTAVEMRSKSCGSASNFRWRVYDAFDYNMFF